MPHPFDTPPSETELEQDIKELRAESPKFYKALDESVKETSYQFHTSLQTVPFQTSVQILLGIERSDHQKGDKVLQEIQKIFLAPQQVFTDTTFIFESNQLLFSSLNEVLAPFKLKATGGPFHVIEGNAKTSGRVALGLEIKKDPKFHQEISWIEMTFTSFDTSHEEAWKNLRYRILELKGV